MKKGQGISLETIIIAIIVLIVLVVLILVFTGRFSLFNKGLDQCPPGPSYCVDSSIECSNNFGRDYLPSPMNCNDDDSIDYCCMKPAAGTEGE